MKKFLVNGVIVCWACSEGGNQRKGGLMKVDKTNYAHKECFTLFGKPGAADQSFRSFEKEAYPPPASKIIAQVPEMPTVKI